MHRQIALVTVLLGASALTLGGPIDRSVSAAGVHPARSPNLRLSSPRPLASTFVGDSPKLAAMRQGRMPAEAMASADFDEDGMPDLIVTHSGADGSGAIALHRGNIDAVYPNEPAARQRRAKGLAVQAPFLPDVRVFDTLEGGDLIGAGDFDADGHRDAVLARRDGTAIFWHRGDGRGSFHPATRIPVPGQVTDLVVGDVNRSDGLEDIVVAIETAFGGKVLVFEGLTGALANPPEELALKGRPAALALGRLDGDGFADLAIASGRNLEVIRGRDRGLYLEGARRARVPRPVAVTAPLPFAVQSLALGEFDGEPGTDVALLDSSRRLAVLAARDFLADPSGAVAELTPAPVEGAGSAGDPSVVRLVTARVSARPDDDLLLIDPGRSAILTTRPVAAGGPRRPTVVHDLGAVKQAIGMRLGRRASDGLVEIIAGEAQVRWIDMDPLATYTVTTISDSGPGSLRQAILDANTTPDEDAIEFDIPGTGPHAIVLATPLPDVMHPVIIDATTEPDYATTPVVRLDAHLLTVDVLVVRGGSSLVRGLSIGGQGGDGARSGVYLRDVGGDIVEGNYIGTNTAGTGPGATFGHGILVTSQNNTIGGTTTEARNVVSGNENTGIIVSNGAFDATIIGNYVGLDVTGTVLVPNGNGVVFYLATTSTLGGTAAGSGNVIAGPNYDLMITQSGSILVQGNFFGTNGAGTAGFGLLGHGVSIWGSSYATIGGWAAGGGNVISGHSLDGVRIMDGPFPAQYNIIVGNRVGVAAGGATAIGNGTGIRIESGPDNFIGSSLTGGGNVISGNGTGILLAGVGGNDVHGNIIGLSATGSSAVPNGIGIDITGPDHWIGGSALDSMGNVISGNSVSGIAIRGSAAGNRVEGNRIGTNMAGTAAFGNATGIDVAGGGTNTLGGVLGATGNLISGNVRGIHLESGAGSTLVKGNLIGTNLSGTAALPNSIGLLVEASTGQIGTEVLSERNVISGNLTHGLEFRSLGLNVLGNFIGTRVDGTGALGNGGSGIRVQAPDLAPPAFLVLGDPGPGRANTIAHNGAAGVTVATGSPIEIRGNVMHSNGGLGIDLAGDGVTLNDAGAGDPDTGPNGRQNFPVINVARATGGSVLVAGTLDSTPGLAATIDVYVSPLCDPLGHGEGETHIGSTTTTLDASGSGTFSLTALGPFGAGDIVTATATVQGRTSEFSACRTVVGTAPDAVTGVKFASTDMLGWDAMPGADVYHLYIGSRETLSGLPTQAADSCQAAVLREMGGTLPPGSNPPPGHLIWFLVTAENQYGEGPLAPGNPAPRLLTSVGTCGDSCAHSPCATGAALEPACSLQPAFVCDKDPHCCDAANGTWDFQCVQQVRTVGRSLLCPESQGQCPHTLCATGQPLAPGCDAPPLAVSCTALVCQADPHCCQLGWDDACIAKMAQVCGYNCT